MKPRITLITLAVDDLERSLKFYRDGLGLPTAGIVGQEFEHGAVAFFDLQAGLKLALWPRASLAHDTIVGNAIGERNIGLGAVPLDDVDDGDVRGSLRRCIVTRRELSPDDLIRFVADPTGTIVPDINRKLPGRGVWVNTDRGAPYSVTFTKEA